MADWLDDLLGGVNKIAQDVLPWYGVGEDIADLFGTNKLGKAPRLPPIPRSGGAGASSAPYGQQDFGAAAEGGGVGGASGAWDPFFGQGDDSMTGTSFMNGNGYGTLAGPRRIMPYTGGVIPSGYRVAQRRSEERRVLK